MQRNKTFADYLQKISHLQFIHSITQAPPHSPLFYNQFRLNLFNGTHISRFSDENKTAREERKEKNSSPTLFRSQFICSSNCMPLYNPKWFKMLSSMAQQQQQQPFWFWFIVIICDRLLNGTFSYFVSYYCYSSCDRTLRKQIGKCADSNDGPLKMSRTMSIIVCNTFAYNAFIRLNACALARCVRNHFTSSYRSK